MRDRLDDTIHSKGEVSAWLGLPCIGLVPQARPPGRMRLHEYLLENPFAPYSEAIRSLVASLQLTPGDRGAKAILVSSSLPGEGKTTLAVSFAVYAARLGRRVLLVDLDLRNPAVLRELGAHVNAGAPRPPWRRNRLEDQIQRVPGLDLDYLPMRRGTASDPMRMFVDDHVAGMLRSLRDQYDCVVIDSAPVLPIAEARLLASLVDRIVFVVKWGSTPRNVARTALDVLRSGAFVKPECAPLASVVVTQVDPRKHATYAYGDLPEYFPAYQPENQDPPGTET
jgi:Mrp family chromosome partitioning ATPase